MKRNGPPPEPTRLKLLKGNPGKRPLNTREPKPRPGAPAIPIHLDDVARREWRRVIRELKLLGLITTVDRAALAAYCMAWSRWVAAELKVKEFGMVIKSPEKGYPMMSPYLVIANQAMKQLRDYLAEFGMSPASRTRIEVDAPPVPLHPMKTGTDGPKASRFFHD